MALSSTSSLEWARSTCEQRRSDTGPRASTPGSRSRSRWRPIGCWQRAATTSMTRSRIGWRVHKLELAADFTGLRFTVHDPALFTGRAKARLTNSQGYRFDNTVETINVGSRRAHVVAVNTHDKSQAIERSRRSASTSVTRRRGGTTGGTGKTAFGVWNPAPAGWRFTSSRAVRRMRPHRLVRARQRSPEGSGSTHGPRAPRSVLEGGHRTH